MATKLNTLNLLALPNLVTPSSGFVSFGAKSDGLYQKIGTTETKLSVDGHTHTFASLTSKPTTLSGYGITDAVNVSEVVTTATANKILKLNSSAQLPASITGNAASATKLQTARTIAGVSFDGTADIAIPFANLASKPTTLAGYGITDGVQINSNNWANFRYANFSIDDKDVVENVTGSLKLDGWYNISIGAEKVFGTRLTINGQSAHDKTQLYFNGQNGSIQYRKSWWNNTPWTELRTIWDSNNLTNLNQLTTRNFSDLQNKPTTLSGYGITDFTSHNMGNPINPDNTTVNAIGYIPHGSVSLFGQDDGGLLNMAYSSTWQSQIFQDFRTGQIALRGKNNGSWTSWRTVWDSKNLTNLNQLTTRNFSDLQNKPTTLAGYGITDVYTKTEVNSALALKLDKSVFDDLFEKVEVSTGVYAIKAKYDFYSIGEVSAFGAGSGSGGGSSYNRLDAWADYDSSKSGWVLSALLGNDLNTRLLVLEAGGSESYQPLDADLTSIAGLTGTSGFLKKIGVNSWELDTNSYALASHTHTFASLIDKPTTLSGYGITDAANISHNHAGVYEPVFTKNTAFNKNFGTAAGTVSEGNHTHTFASLTSKPTTLAGYGITDAASSSHTHTFASLTSKPTTLSGYGITDAAISFGNRTNTATTTIDFITQLANWGMFNYGHSFCKFSWSYAGNADLTDTGFGTIETAGAICETWQNGDGTKMLRLICPNTGAGAYQELIYNDQGSGYSPGWRKVWNSRTLVNISQLVNDVGYITASASITGNASTAAKLQTTRYLWGRPFDGSGNVDGALTGVTTLTASTSVTVPKVIFAAAGWSVEQTGTEIQFKYNNVVKQRLLSDGSIVAVGEVTAYGATS